MRGTVRVLVQFRCLLPPARDRVRGAFRGASLRGDGRHDLADRCGRAARRGGAAPCAPRAPLPQLPPPRPRARDRAAVRAGRPAQEGCGAASAAWLLRRPGGDGGGVFGFFGSGAGAALAERAAALVAVAALAGAGGAALGTGALRGDREAGGGGRVAAERSVVGKGEEKRGATGAATGGERRGARQASGRRGSGPAGGRAGDKTERGGARTESGSQGGTRSRPQVPPWMARPPSCRPSLPSRGTTAPGSPSVELDLPVPAAPRVTVPVPTPAAGGTPVHARGTGRAAAGHGPVTDALPTSFPDAPAPARG